MATEVSERETELLAEIEQLKAARTSILTGGQSASMGGISKTNASLTEISRLLKQANRDLQRIRNGGRIIAINVSNATTGGTMPQILTGVV